MNEYYLRIHVFERDDEDDSIVKFVVPDSITKEKLNHTIDDVVETFSLSDRDDEDIDDMADEILDSVAKQLGCVWSSCDMLDVLELG